ncbi:heavy-metal-associated domain-containing protein [Caloranaerobacter azorensis]|uniref:Copper ion binding protein n=2 Tax=Caloranaerobacter azorensis TaxID=116090 RepID=A0A1M5UG07_9FIRM|nr:copper ion binding protein [Caloranaerobacter azorensis]QIB27766.1 heavy-metal-associated domain-containing protein [Caloranaerobacter azorensis]SHH61766.1 copper ion binding protein [Caloranaerobacter azorensis DSM 13643]
MTKVLFIEGMSCNHCIMAVKKALSEVEGVTSVDVDLESKKAVVEFSKEVGENILKDAVIKAGYEVVSIE